MFPLVSGYPCPQCVQQEHLPEEATTKSCLWLWFVSGLILAPVDSTFGAVELRVKSGPDTDRVPRWRGLNHFGAYVSVEFTDGSKWEDMSKVCHN